MKNWGKILVVFLLAVIAVLLFFVLKKPAPEPVTPEPTPIEDKSPEISFEEETIDNDFVDGKYPEIKGSGKLALLAREYVTEQVDEFNKIAVEEVADVRKRFGDDTFKYSLEMSAELKKSPDTETIVIRKDTYTGGASGNSEFATFSANSTGEQPLLLGDVIRGENQALFTAEVKKKLIEWRPEGMEEMVVFTSEVSKLSFASFKKWALEGDKLTLYFNKYEIGPGALGAVPFELSKSEIGGYLSMD